VLTLERIALVFFDDAEIHFEEAAVGSVGDQLDRLVAHRWAFAADPARCQSALNRTTTRQRAKRPIALEVASKACTQAFGIHNPLENGFGTGFWRSLGFPRVFSPMSGR
jgi:hypothetical protein